MDFGLPGLSKIPAQKWKMLVLEIGAGKTFTNWFPNFLKAPPNALSSPMMALVNHLASGSICGLWITRNNQNPSPQWKMFILCNGAGKPLTNWFPGFLEATLSVLQGLMTALMNH
jgi:hypothetical protein